MPDLLGLIQAYISDVISAYNCPAMKKVSGMIFMTVPDGLTRVCSEMGREELN